MENIIIPKREEEIANVEDGYMYLLKSIGKYNAKNKNLDNSILLRKRCSWYVGIILIMYLIVIPYQINLIDFLKVKKNIKTCFGNRHIFTTMYLF